MSPPVATVSPRAVERVASGHLWIYRSDVTAVSASPGDTVRVADGRGRVVGYALYSATSQITLRMLTRGERPADRDLWRERLQQALAFRGHLALDATAYRLVHGEGDLLPSLIVDRYGDYLIVQALSQAVDRLLPDIVQLLVEMTTPAGILARNDAKVRALEGLDRQVTILHGEVPALVSVTENGVRYDADVWKGQKTGLFLDQRENRRAAARYARGDVLDCFSYNGGFALTAAPRAERVVAVDISEDAVARVSANARANGLSNIEVRTANVFDELRELARGDERFDLIVLDPPAFAKTKTALAKALSGYKEINLRALRLLRPGGTLVTCTCSYHVDEATFGEVVYDAARDAGVAVGVVEKRMQGRDHPVLLGVPETYYLKCFVLRRLA